MHAGKGREGEREKREEIIEERGDNRRESERNRWNEKYAYSTSNASLLSTDVEDVHSCACRHRRRKRRHANASYGM
jgi:hypothetical protein